MPTRRATRKSYGGELSGGELSGGAMASRVRLANLARGRAVRAANIMKTRAKGGILLVPYKRKDPRTGKLVMRKGPDPVKEKGLYLRNAKRLLKWIKQVDPEGEGDGIVDVEDLLADPARLLRIDELYEENMKETRGVRKPGYKPPKKAKAPDNVDPYLRGTRIVLNKMTDADVELELAAIARVAPFLNVMTEGTGDFDKDIKLIRFVRKLLPKMPSDKLTSSVYERFLERLKDKKEEKKKK